MAVTAQQFIEQISSVSLLSAAELDTVRGKLDPTQLTADAEQLARELVKAGKLTKYQAAAIYQGRGKGLVLGEYVVLDKLGAGGMGQVFKAQHRKMKRLAAVKVLPPHMTKTPQAVQRFYQEVEMAAKLNHPNIVQAYDAAEASGLHFLVMEFVDGRDLSAIVGKQGPLSIEQAMNCVRQAAEGLAYAHAQHVIHRDIKPSNLLIDRQGNVKILDMGLARTVDAVGKLDAQSSEGLTQAGQVMGTVDYMAPEQARDARTADHRADIYSLGCTLYRLLTGQVPFQGDTMVKKLMAHASEPIPSLEAKRADVPGKLEALYQRMMVKDPAGRICSAKEVAATLKELLTGISETKSSISVLDEPQQSQEWQSFLKSGDPSAPTKGHSAAGSAPRRKDRMPLYIAAAGVALLLVLGGVWYATRSRETPKVAANPPLPSSVSGDRAEEKQRAQANMTSTSTGPADVKAPSAPPTPLPTTTEPTVPASAPPALSKQDVKEPTPAAPSPPAPAAAAPTQVAGASPPAPLAPAVPSKPADPPPPVAKTAEPAPAESGENHALYFDGKTAYVEIPSLRIPQDSKSIVTWEAKIWPKSQFGAVGGVLTTNYNQGSAVGTTLQLTGSGPRFRRARQIDGSRRFFNLDGGSTFPVDFQRIIAVVFDNDEWRLFVDGQEVASARPLGIADEPSTPHFIGVGYFAGGKFSEFFHGVIDEVRISNVARYRNSYTPTERFETDEHTLALYHFNEATGETLYDYSGHGHHGNIFGAQWIKSPGVDPRVPVPSASELAMALSTIEDSLKTDLAKAKTPADKAALAQRLLTDSANTERASAERYALAQRALELAVESGDALLVKQLLASQQATIQGSPDMRLADALSAAAKKTAPGQLSQVYARLALEAWYRAFGEDQFDTARKLSETASLVVRKANDQSLTKAATEIAKRMTALKAAMDAAIAAQQKLTADKADAEAHLVLGQYLCFDKEDWLPGLEHLSKGSDEALKSLAGQSLAAEGAVDKIVASGDAWFDAASKATGKTKQQFQSAAVFLYLESYSLAAGADRSHVETRLNQMNLKNRPITFTQAKREREAAEWVLQSDRNSVELIGQGESAAHSATKASGLPPTPFAVTLIRLDYSAATTPTPTEWRQLSRLKYIREIWTNLCRVHKEGALAIGRLSSLERLTLSNADVSDLEIAEFKSLANLESLALPYNYRVTDNCIDHLRPLSKLRKLDLYTAKISDTGVPKLLTLPALTSLRLGNSSLTDAGLLQFARFQKLASLTFDASRFSNATVQQLAAALPRCKVTVNPPTGP